MSANSGGAPLGFLFHHFLGILGPLRRARTEGETQVKNVQILFLASTWIFRRNQSRQRRQKMHSEPGTVFSLHSKQNSVYTRFHRKKSRPWDLRKDVCYHCGGQGLLWYWGWEAGPSFKTNKQQNRFFLKEHLPRRLICNIVVSTPIVPLLKHLQCISPLTFKPISSLEKLKALRKSASPANIRSFTSKSPVKNNICFDFSRQIEAPPTWSL